MTAPATLTDSRLWPVLGICPLAYAADSLATGLALGFSSFAVTMATSLVAWALRGQPVSTIRPAAGMILLAVIVTLLGLLMRAFLYELHLVLALALLVLVANASILGTADKLAALGTGELAALLPALGLGTAFFLVLTVTGLAREQLGKGLVAAADFHVAETPASAFLILAAFAVAAKAAARRDSGTGP